MELTYLYAIFLSWLVVVSVSSRKGLKDRFCNSLNFPHQGPSDRVDQYWQQLPELSHNNIVETKIESDVSVWSSGIYYIVLPEFLSEPLKFINS